MYSLRIQRTGREGACAYAHILYVSSARNRAIHNGASRLILSAIHASRVTCLPPKRSYGTFAAASILGGTSSIMPAGKHIRARVVAAQSSYPRATLCA